MKSIHSSFNLSLKKTECDYIIKSSDVTETFGMKVDWPRGMQYPREVMKLFNLPVIIFIRMFWAGVSHVHACTVFLFKYFFSFFTNLYCHIVIYFRLTLFQAFSRSFQPFTRTPHPHPLFPLLPILKFSRPTSSYHLSLVCLDSA